MDKGTGSTIVKLVLGTEKNQRTKWEGSSSKVRRVRTEAGAQLISKALDVAAVWSLLTAAVYIISA